MRSRDAQSNTGEWVGNGSIITCDQASLKAGVNVKAVFTSLNTAFLPISRSRFMRRQIPSLIALSTIWQFCVNFWVFLGVLGKRDIFSKDRLN